MYNQLNEKFEEIMQEVFATFSMWEAYDNFVKIFQYNSNLQKLNKYIPSQIGTTAQEGISIRLRRIKKELVEIIEKINNQSSNNKELKFYVNIIEGRILSVIKIIDEELKKIFDLHTFFREIQEETQKLINKYKRGKGISPEIIPKLEEIKNKITEKENEIDSTLQELENENSGITKSVTDVLAGNEPPESLLPIIESKKALDINEKINSMRDLKEHFQEIRYCIIFKQLWVFINGVIAHKQSVNIDNSIEISVSRSEVFKAIDETVKKVFRLVKGSNLASLTPLYQGNPFTIFMVPWLMPAYMGKEKTEILDKIVKYKEEQHYNAHIYLSDGSLFHVENFPPEYKWEEGDEIAVFLSYNYEKPKAGYVICNFSKKEWVKGMDSKGSWIYPERLQWKNL